jgi:hypothetical protein
MAQKGAESIMSESGEREWGKLNYRMKNESEMAFARRSGDRQTSRGGLKTLASRAILTRRGQDLAPAG